MSRWSKRCQACRERAIIEAAIKVEPSCPLVLIDSDTFFADLDAAAEEHGGDWAHPCDEEPLKVNARRVAAELAERVVEDMCEEAFEDADSHVKGVPELTAAFAVALEAFNSAQVASSWNPRVKEVFQIPASGIEAPSGGETPKSGSTVGESPAPKGGAQP